MKKQNAKRVVIYPKDVELLTGKSAATARRILQQIRKCLGKEETEYVTIQEFCFFTGIPEDLVLETLT
jgi:N-dimethylarginine dimethylaminohydrolase